MFNLPELADFLSTLLPAIYTAKYFICSINRNIHKTCYKGIQPVWELVKGERKRQEHITGLFPEQLKRQSISLVYWEARKKKGSLAGTILFKAKICKSSGLFLQMSTGKKKTKKNTTNKQQTQQRFCSKCGHDNLQEQY